MSAKGALPGADAPRPMYRVPRLALAGFAMSLLTGRRRSFTGDGRVVMDANPYPRVVLGAENVPETGSFVVVMSHYSRRGLRPYHCAMAVSVALATRRPHGPEARWAFTSEYRGRRVGPVPIPLWSIRWLFRRVAKVYGFVVIPRREDLVMARAAALRSLARRIDLVPVGLTPEGLEGSGRLVEPPPGNGLFIASLVERGAPMLPVGVWEEGDTLCIRFGEPRPLSLARGVTRDEQDRFARTEIMVAIGQLLPASLHGAYAAEISAASRRV